MNLTHTFLNAMVALLLCCCGLAVYDRWVRQPNTPRLAVVDANHLLSLAQQRAARQAAQAIKAEGSNPSVATSAALSATLQTVESFGVQMEATLKQLSGECHCTLVAMAAVFGETSTVPDYTGLVAQRLGFEEAKP